MPTLRPPGSKRAFCIFFSGRVFLARLFSAIRSPQRPRPGRRSGRPIVLGRMPCSGSPSSVSWLWMVAQGARRGFHIRHVGCQGEDGPARKKGRSDRTSALRPFFIRRYSASSDKPKRFKSCSVSTRTPLCISSAAVTPEPGVRTPAKVPSYT